MTLTELNEYLLVASNQYYVGEKDIEVTEPVLTLMVKRGLKKYGDLRPLWIQANSVPVNSFKQEFKEYEGRRVLNVSNMYYYEPLMNGDDGKVLVEWDYIRDTGILRTQAGGSYYIEMFVLPLLEDIGFDQTEFLDLMTGLYLMYVGSTRKGFTLGELPFENDGAELYEAGKELYEETLAQLGETNDNWYLAIT